MIISQRHFHHYSINNKKYRKLHCYRNKILWAVLLGRYWLGYKNTDEHDFTIRVLSISCFISLRPSCLWRGHFMNTNRKSLSIHNRQSSHRGIKHMYNMYYINKSFFQIISLPLFEVVVFSNFTREDNLKIFWINS